jgi:transposase InsO family protein
MANNSGKLLEFFLRLPKLSIDGTNWIVFRDRFSFAADAAGLARHINGSGKAPAVLAALSTTPSKTEKETWDANQKEWKEWTQGEAVMKQAIAGSIPDSLFIQVGKQTTAKGMWDAVKSDREKRSRMVQIEMRRKIQDERCDEGADVRTHVMNLQTMREEYASMGGTLDDSDFAAMLLGSLPASYDVYLSAISGSASVTGTELTADQIIQAVTNESDRRQSSNRSSKPKKDSKDVALTATGGGQSKRNGKAKSGTCHNCGKKGHWKRDCYAEGGGKAGQGPKQKKKGSGSGKEKESAAVASEADETIDEAVFMAMAVGDSGGEVELARAQDRVQEALEAPEDDNDDLDSLPDLEWQSDSDDGSDYGDDADSLPDLGEQSDSESGSVCGGDDDDDGDSLPDLQSQDESEVRSSLGDGDDEGDWTQTEEDISYAVFGNSSTLTTDLPAQKPSLLSRITSGFIDTGDDAFTRKFNSAMLANILGDARGESELYDSGVSRHMSPYRHQFINFCEIVPKTIVAADQGTFEATGLGDMRIQVPNGQSTTNILLRDVLYAPKMGLTLVSVSKIAASGYSTLFLANYAKIMDRRRRVIARIPVSNGIYRVEHPGMGTSAGSAEETVSVMDLHRRMGHIAPEAARRLMKEGLVTGVKLDEASEITECDSCEYAKMHRKAVGKEKGKDSRATKFGEEVHSDVWGPSPISTIHGRFYYVTFIDDNSRLTHIHLLRRKDQAFDAYLIYEAWVKTQKNTAIKKLHTDHGGEYLSDAFSEHLAKAGTARNLTVHDTPEHNGVAERSNRTLLERVRAMLHSSGLPKFLWGEAVKHAVYLKNRTATRALANKTPYEMAMGVKPNLSDLHEWGCKVWVHSAGGSKLDGRAAVGRWVGYDDSSSGHRIYWPDRRSVTVERSVKFSEEAAFPPLEGEPGLPIFEQTSSSSIHPIPTGPHPNVPAPVIAVGPLGVLPGVPIVEPAVEPERTAGGRGQRVRKESDYLRRLRAGEGNITGKTDAPKIPRGVQVVHERPETAALAELESDNWEMVDIGLEGARSALVAAMAEADALEPTYEEAKKRSDWPMWKDAIAKELAALKAAGTWKVVERPMNRNVVDSKWVFRVKKNAGGEIEKWKARLVARGFSQVYGVDYFETFAPVARLASIRSILAIAARNGWPIDMFDFNSAFLNGELDANEEIFMEQPPDYETAERRTHVCQLLKTIYGLKQAGRRWYETLCRGLEEIGFVRCQTDPAVFSLRSGTNLAVLAIHVDDSTFTATSRLFLDKTKSKIAKKFKITDLGPISWLLGVSIRRNEIERTISLSQTAYIDSILRRFNFTDCKALAMPMDPNSQLTKDQGPKTIVEVARMKSVPYREAVGSLNWLAVATRPDISFAVGTLAQFMENPGEAHWEAAKRVFRYLQGTREWKLTYGGEEKSMVGFTDADGMSQEHRHAISGYAILIDGGAVSWGSKKQELVVLSTTEAEYVAATHAAKEVLWLRRFLSEIFEPITEPTTLYSDNQSAIALAHSQGHFHARTKHIDIRYHFIRFTIESGSIRLVYCPTDEMTADVLTKALPNTKAKHFARALGLSPV